MGMPSIQNDGCIIEEQPDHLVVALRLPKALIRANLPLMSAVADRCSPGLGRAIAERVSAPYISPDPPHQQRRYFTPRNLMRIFVIAAYHYHPHVGNRRRCGTRKFPVVALDDAPVGPRGSLS